MKNEHTDMIAACVGIALIAAICGVLSWVWAVFILWIYGLIAGFFGASIVTVLWWAVFLTMFVGLGRRAYKTLV